MSSGHGEIVFQVLRRISKSTGLSEVQGFARSSITMQSFLSLYFIVDFLAGGGGGKSGVWSILFVRPSRFPPAKFVNTTSPSRRSKSEMVLKSLDRERLVHPRSTLPLRHQVAPPQAVEVGKAV